MAKPVSDEVKQWAIDLIDGLLEDVLAPQVSNIPMIALGDEKIEQARQRAVQRFAETLKLRVKES